MGWSELSGLEWVGVGWSGLSGLEWVEWVEWVGVGWSGLSGLEWVGVGWSGLEWVGVNRLIITQPRPGSEATTLKLWTCQVNSYKM